MLDNGFELPRAPEESLFSRTSRFYKVRQRAIAHTDEHMTAWLRQNELDMSRLVREQGELDPSHFAPVMADLAGLLSKHAEARKLFMDASAKLHPELAAITIANTKESLTGKLETVVDILQQSDPELAARFRVELVQAKRRPLGDLGKIVDSWSSVIRTHADHMAYEVFDELQQNLIVADVAQEAHRELSYEVEAAYLLERMRDTMDSATV